MWSTVLTLVLLVSVVLGLAAGLGLTWALFQLLGAVASAEEAHAEDGRRRWRRLVWTAWWVRLLAVVSLPWLGAGFVLVSLWGVGAGPLTRALLILPMCAVGVPLFLSPLVLWDHPFGTVGWSVLAVAAFGLLDAAFAGGWGVRLGLLEWRGGETTCTVLDSEGRAVQDPAGGESEIWRYTLDCAAADAPDEMTTFTAVSGERMPVVYDPSGLLGVVPRAEFAHLDFTIWAAGVSVVLWTVPSVGNVLYGIPLARNPNAWP
ncbi:hypothetical protein [Streptomyces mayteni]